MKIDKITYLIFITLFILTIPGFAIAQTAAGQNSVEKVVQDPLKFKVRLFEIRHRNPESLRVALRALGSGTPGADMEANQQLRTLTVRDFPENITAIEEALKRLDVPEQSPASLEFQIHLISASTGPEPKVQVSKNLEPVITQLKSSLRFTNFRYISTALSRANDGGKVDSSGISGSLFPAPSGITNNPDNPSFYMYSLGTIKLMQDSTGKETVQIDNFRFGVTVPVRSSGGGVQYRDIGINSPLTLREGEMAVVGTASISGSDEAIIVVVSVNKIK